MEELITWGEVRELSDAFPYGDVHVNKQKGVISTIELKWVLKKDDVGELLKKVRTIKS